MARIRIKTTRDPKHPQRGQDVKVTAICADGTEERLECVTAVHWWVKGRKNYVRARLADVECDIVAEIPAADLRQDEDRQ